MVEETSKDVAVAVTAIARYLSSKDQTFASHLYDALKSAEGAGLTEKDLRLIKMLIASLSQKSKRDE